MEKILIIYITEYNSFITKRQILHVQLLWFKILYFYISENENPELYKNGGRSAMLQILPRGRSAMKGGRSAMLQTFPLGGRSAMLQIFRGKVCNAADLPGGGFAMLQTFRGEGLQGGRSAIQHRCKIIVGNPPTAALRKYLIYSTMIIDG